VAATVPDELVGMPRLDFQGLKAILLGLRLEVRRRQRHAPERWGQKST